MFSQRRNEKKLEYIIVEIPNNENFEEFINIESSIKQVAYSDNSGGYNTGNLGVYRIAKAQGGTVVWQTDSNTFLYTKEEQSESNLIFSAHEHLSDDPISYDEFLDKIK